MLCFWFLSESNVQKGVSLILAKLFCISFAHLMGMVNDVRNVINIVHSVGKLGNFLGNLWPFSSHYKKSINDINNIRNDINDIMNNKKFHNIMKDIE